jgi:hypothetical protein
MLFAHDMSWRSIHQRNRGLPNVHVHVVRKKMEVTKRNPHVMKNRLKQLELVGLKGSLIHSAIDNNVRAEALIQVYVMVHWVCMLEVVEAPKFTPLMA